MLSEVQRLVVADAPGWRSDSGSELGAPPIQQILAERTDANGNTKSQYVVLMVPYTSQRPPLLSARVIQSDLETGAVAVEVKLPGRTDTIISTLDHKQRQYGQQAYLLGGSRLCCGELEITLPDPIIQLRVKSVTDRTFHLAQPLPQNLTVDGLYLLAGETGYEIQSATKDSVTDRDYPAIDCKQIRILNSRWWQPAPRVEY